MQKKTFITVLLLAGMPHAVSALEVLDNRFELINEFDAPAELTAAFGDLLFSADGNLAYIIDQSEDSPSAVWMASVARDDAGNVSGFDTFTQVFADVGIDTGLSFGPGTDTFVYRTEVNGITQRLNDGTIEGRPITNYDPSFGGLTFVPEAFSTGGDIVSVSYNEGVLYQHPTAPDGDGSFTINDPTTFADFSGSIGTSTIGDVAYVTSGPLAGTMMITAYNNSDTADIYHFPIDSATGLPAEGLTPTPVPFVNNGDNEAWGVATDPVTGNIWLIEFDGTGSDFFQIGSNPPSTNAMAAPSRVFVTSTTYTGSAFEGLSGADSICNQRAAAGSLGGTYTAWLSTSTTDAADRVYHNPNGYITTNGDMVANSWADLINADSEDPPSVDLLHSINYDEFGVDVGTVQPWTGTFENGLATTANCNNWTSSDGSDLGITGLTNDVNQYWSEYFPQRCNRTQPLYCVENAPVYAVPSMNKWGMIIFVVLAGLGSVYYMRRSQRA